MNTTMETTKVNTPAEKAQRLYAVMQTWPHWEEIGLCCQKEYAISLEAYARRLPEYQKFMALCMSFEHIGMISSDIDILWHGHILHTELYLAFCTEYGKFIHHLPCSSYGLYGVSDEAFVTSECTSCKKPICSVKPTCYDPLSSEEKAVSIAAIRQSILISASEFRRAYQEAFGDLPDVWSMARQGDD